MKLNILVTTDIHGNIFPTNYADRNNVENYGLARIATAIKDFRKSHQHTLVLDNGDVIQGTPLLTYALQNKDAFKNPMAEAFNILNYDYVNLGNHDFNFGQDHLFDYINQTKAPLLTSNVLFRNKPLGNTQILEFEGKKIALIGLLTQYIPRWERPAFIKDMTFISAYQQLKIEIEKVRNEVDVVIAMYHGGMERDLFTGEPTEKLTGENEGYEMTQIDGLDILITGHQHRSFVETVNHVLVTQSTFKGQEYITIELDLNSLEAKATLHHTNTLGVDESFLAHFKTIQDNTQDWLDKKIGFLKDGDVMITDQWDARIHKHPLVSLLNQIQMERTGAQLSGVSLFNNTVGFNQEITMRDVVGTYQYPNTLVVKKISGKNLKEYLEMNASYFMIMDDKITYDPKFEWPKPQHYNYDMVDGIDYTIKVSNPINERVLDISIDGKPLVMDAYYTLVTNNYRAGGGGNFYMVSESETLEEINEEMVDTMMHYFKKHPVVTVNHKDNIKVIL